MNCTVFLSLLFQAIPAIKANFINSLQGLGGGKGGGGGGYGAPPPPSSYGAPAPAPSYNAPAPAPSYGAPNIPSYGQFDGFGFNKGPGKVTE